jgi:AcrR family transcriptional regulator
MPASTKPSPRERLLDATELFYAEGVQSVGIDRVIAHAGVGLPLQHLREQGSPSPRVSERRHQVLIDRLRRAADQVDDPVERLLAVFEAQAALFDRPDFRGCAYVAAAAEAPSEGQIAEYRQEVRGLFVELAAEAGIADPEQLADQLRLIYDGGSIAANLDHNPGIASPAWAAARILIEVAPRAGGPSSAGPG